MSPNNIKQKAEKYRMQFAAMYRQSHLMGCRGLSVDMKHSTIRDLLNFFSELSGVDAERSASEEGAPPAV